MSKGLKFFSVALFVISAVIGIMFYLNMPEKPEDSMVNVILIFSYILLGLGILLIVLLPLPTLFQYPKKLKKIALSFLIVLAVFAIGYFLASGDPVPINTDTPPSSQVLKVTDTGLIITYIMVAISLVVIIAGSVKTLIDKKQ